MRSRKPLGIQQRQLTRLHRHNFMYVKNSRVDVGHIDIERDGTDVGRVRGRRDGRRHGDRLRSPGGLLGARLAVRALAKSCGGQDKAQYDIGSDIATLERRKGHANLQLFKIAKPIYTANGPKSSLSPEEGGIPLARSLNWFFVMPISAASFLPRKPG